MTGLVALIAAAYLLLGFLVLGFMQGSLRYGHHLPELNTWPEDVAALLLWPRLAVRAIRRARRGR